MDTLMSSQATHEMAGSAAARAAKCKTLQRGGAVAPNCVMVQWQLSTGAM